MRGSGRFLASHTANHSGALGEPKPTKTEFRGEEEKQLPRQGVVTICSDHEPAVRKRKHGTIRAQILDQMAGECGGPLSTALSFSAGPMVRIQFPPAVSLANFSMARSIPDCRSFGSIAPATLKAT